MIRSGVCQRRFDIGPILHEYRIMFDTFTRIKRNLYKNTWTNALHSVRFYFPGFLMINQDGKDFSPKFSTGQDMNSENASIAVNCWKTYSEFVVYQERYSSLFYLENMVTIPTRSACSPDQLLFFDRDDDDCRFLVLSWFDRVHRMIFSRYLSKFQISHSSYSVLIIFIHEYL
jgi:hypothetical protein